MSKLPRARPINFRDQMRSEIPTSTCMVHGIDRYPAKLIPQAARYLLRKYVPEGGVVLDPFCGTGAVLVEASLTGHPSIGVDLNPLATLFASVKTTAYTEGELDEAVAAFRRRVHRVKPKTFCDFPNATMWFTPQVLVELARIRRTILLTGATLSDAQRRFLTACLVRIVRRCSRADPRGPKPFISKSARRRNKGANVDALLEFYEAVNSVKARLLQYADCFDNGHTPGVRVVKGDARDLLSCRIKGSVSAVVTSPPYINAQDYFRSSKLELRVAGLMPEAKMLAFSRSLIGTDRGRLDGVPTDAAAASRVVARVRERLAAVSERHARILWKYFVDMRRVFRQMASTVAPGGKICVVVGTNRMCGIDIPTHSLLASVAEAEGIGVEELLVDVIKNRHLPPERNGHDGVIARERVLVMTVASASL